MQIGFEHLIQSRDMKVAAAAYTLATSVHPDFTTLVAEKEFAF